MSMSFFDCHDFMDGYNRGKREGTIEELTKIKDEMIGICNHNNCYNCVFSNLKDEKCLLKTTINEHIAELKGEK